MTTVNINAADILKALNLAGEIYLNAKKGYDATRAIAEQAGISTADLDAADARFLHHYDDPLGGPTSVPVGVPSDDPYAEATAEYPNTKLLKPGDQVWQRGDGKFVASPSGVGTVHPPDWRLVETIGG